MERELTGVGLRFGKEADLIAVEDALIRQFQQDVWAARGYTATQDTLTLR